MKKILFLSQVIAGRRSAPLCNYIAIFNRTSWKTNFKSFWAIPSKLSGYVLGTIRNIWTTSFSNNKAFKLKIWSHFENLEPNFLTILGVHDFQNGIFSGRHRKTGSPTVIEQSPRNFHGDCSKTVGRDRFWSSFFRIENRECNVITCIGADLRPVITSARNNIFHGTKSIW